MATPTPVESATDRELLERIARFLERLEPVLDAALRHPLIRRVLGVR